VWRGQEKKRHREVGVGRRAGQRDSLRLRHGMSVLAWVCPALRCCFCHGVVFLPFHHALIGPRVKSSVREPSHRDFKINYITLVNKYFLCCKINTHLVLNICTSKCD
jgi:hypothetical protein